VGECLIQIGGFQSPEVHVTLCCDARWLVGGANEEEDVHLRGLVPNSLCVTSAKRIPAALGCSGIFDGIQWPSFVTAPCRRQNALFWQLEVPKTAKHSG
jgi:hypothetical protein